MDELEQYIYIKGGDAADSWHMCLMDIRALPESHHDPKTSLGFVEERRLRELRGEFER